MLHLNLLTNLTNFIYSSNNNEYANNALVFLLSKIFAITSMLQFLTDFHTASDYQVLDIINVLIYNINI